MEPYIALTLNGFISILNQIFPPNFPTVFSPIEQRGLDRRSGSLRNYMKALILAAGRGRRLWPFTADRPKCLLHIGGTSLLERQLYHLQRAGVTTTVVIGGFGIEGMREAVATFSGSMHVKLLYNPFYATSDNLISLWVARCEMDGELLLVNGDNIFHPAVLDALLGSTGDCCLLAERKGQYEADAMKLQLYNTRVARVGKEIPHANAESLGILRFSTTGAEILRSALEEIVFEEKALYSHFPAVIQHLIDRRHEVCCCFAPGFPCSDIDTPTDLDRARQHLHLYNEHHHNTYSAQPARRLADSPI